MLELHTEKFKAVTLQEQDSIQRELPELERQQRKQIFDVED